MKLLTTLFIVILVSGCVREESPLWFMTKDNNEINQFYVDKCISDYGHSRKFQSDLNKCAKALREIGATDASNRMNAVSQQLIDMDMQRINNHNAAVISHQNRQGSIVNVYKPNGQLGGYSKNGNWYNSDGSYAGYIRDNQIYGATGQNIGFIKGNNYYNADGTYAGFQK